MGNNASGGIDVNNLGEQDFYSDPFNSASLPGNDPFPMEDFRSAQIPQMLNRPQQNTISGVMNEIGSGINQNPVFNRYFNLASQGPPKREDYEAGTGRKILAALGGISSIFSDPQHAGQNTAAILDRPYDLAAGQYARDLGVASDAVKQEGSLLNSGVSIFRDIAQQENFRNLAENRGQRLGFDYTKLDQTGDIASQKMELQGQKQLADKLFQQGRLGNEAYRNLTGRLQYQLDKLESPSLINSRDANTDFTNARASDLQFGPIRGSRSSGPTVKPPSTSSRQFDMSNDLITDPLLKKYFDISAGRFRPEMQKDEAAMERYDEIRARYSNLDRTPWDPNTLNFNTGGLPDFNGEP